LKIFYRCGIYSDKMSKKVLDLSGNTIEYEQDECEELGCEYCDKEFGSVEGKGCRTEVCQKDQG
jgi:hypothetical protein